MVTEEGKTVTKGIIEGLQKSMSQQGIDKIWSNLDSYSSSRESKLKQTACSPIFASTWRRRA